jgi:hypothetical protein
LRQAGKLYGAVNPRAPLPELWSRRGDGFEVEVTITNTNQSTREAWRGRAGCRQGLPATTITDQSRQFAQWQSKVFTIFLKKKRVSIKKKGWKFLIINQQLICMQIWFKKINGTINMHANLI